jgi:hypothetical protein
MATQTVTRFTCDICKTTAEPENPTGTAKKVTAPKDWSEVIGVDRRKALDIQLCPDCTKAIKDDRVKVQTKLPPREYAPQEQ